MIFKNEIIEQKWIKETSQTAKHGQTKVVVKVWKKNYMTVIDVKNEGQNEHKDKNLEKAYTWITSTAMEKQYDWMTKWYPNWEKDHHRRYKMSLDRQRKNKQRKDGTQTVRKEFRKRINIQRGKTKVLIEIQLKYSWELICLMDHRSERHYEHPVPNAK